MRRRSRRRLLVPLLGVAALVVLASGCVMNGTWVATTPVPAADQVLSDVSCVSASWCIAGGSSVQTWDGTAWTPGVAPPQGVGGGELISIECAAADSCMALVARYTLEPDDFEYLMVWDGETWTDVPPGWTTEGAFVESAPYSCAPDGSCVAILNQYDRIVTWDGDSFTTVLTGLQPDWFESSAIECQSSTDCLVVSEGATAHWDGATLTMFDTPYLDVAAIRDLSCVSATSCVGIGELSPPNFTGVRWDGSAWSTQALPAGVNFGAGVDLSCASGAECIAVGENPSRTIAWNGTQWFDAPTAPGPAGSRYRGVSCVPQRCMAVGRTTAPVPTALAATYSWTNT